MMFQGMPSMGMPQQQQMPGMGQPLAQTSQSQYTNPLDAITKLFGLPDGFLDGILPFSPYQTLPVQMDRSQSGVNPAPQSQTSPNPLAQQIPPPPMQGMLQQNAAQGPMGMMGQMPGMGGMGGMGMGMGMGGMPGMMPGMMPGGMGGGMPSGMPGGMGMGMPQGMPQMPNLQALMSGMGRQGMGAGALPPMRPPMRRKQGGRR